MALGFNLDLKPGAIEKQYRGIEQPMAAALTSAMTDVRNQVTRDGRAAIRAARLGTRFANALRATRYPKIGESMSAAVWVYHRIDYAGVFQEGAQIAGNPLLWLPFAHTPTAIGGRRLTAADYVRTVGPLHSIRVPGRPPMLAAYIRGVARAGAVGTGSLRGGKLSITRLRSGGALARLGVRSRRSDTGSRNRAGVISVPLFFGVRSVSLKRRFDLEPIFERGRAQLRSSYIGNLGRMVK